MGMTYSDLGQKAKTLESYNQALSIWKEIGNLQGQASSLDYLGRVYSDLGQKQTALDYFNQGLPVWRESGNRNGEALDLNDIGRAHADLGQPQQALDFCNQALTDLARSGQPPRRSDDPEQHGPGLSRPGTAGQSAGGRTTSRSQSGAK